MSLPPTLNASGNETGSEWTPGSRSSGKMTCSRARLCASSRASSSSRTVEAREAALVSPWWVSVTAFPPTVSPWTTRRRSVPGSRGVRQRPWVLSSRGHRAEHRGQHFREHGWVVVDALPWRARSELAAWVDEIAALPEAVGVLQHREATDSGRSCAAANNFSKSIAGCASCSAPDRSSRSRAVLLDEPAVLYKEKINYKLPGGAGYTAHQDAPAYPMITSHVSAMIAVDDASSDNGGLEVVSGCFASVLPTDARGCIDGAIVETLAWEPVTSRRAAPCGSTAVRPTAAAPTTPIGPAGRCTRPTTPDARVTAAPSTTRRSAACSRPPRPEIARRSRSSGTSKDGRREGRVHRARRAPRPSRRRRPHAGPGRAGRAAGGAPGRATAVMTSATYPNHASFATGVAPREHGIVTNWVPETGRLVPAWKLGPARTDAVRRVPGRRGPSAAVFSDQCLVGVMGARAADAHWPPDGVPPAEVRRDAHDYIDDRDTMIELVAALDAGPDVVVSQLNAPDTAAHVEGPDTEAAFGCTARPMRSSVAVRDHLDWNDTVWIIVSDHDQETLDDRRPVDLRPEFARRGWTSSRSPKAAPP